MEYQATFTTAAQQIRCFTHGKMCTMVCTFKGCTNRTICTECILTHQKNHLSKIQPLKDFDAQSNHIPKMIAKDLNQIRQRMTILLNHIVQSREGRKSEVKRLLALAIETVQNDLHSFQKETGKEVDQFYSKPHQLVSEVIADCENHLEGLQPYLSEVVSHQDSKRFDFLLNYQEKLLTIILPQLAQDADATGKKVMSQELEVTSENFTSLFSSYLHKGFQLYRSSIFSGR